MAIVSRVLAVVLPILCVGAAPARGHGDLSPTIAEVSAHLLAELRKPVDGHHRAKLHLERGERYRLHREFERAARDYDARGAGGALTAAVRA